MAVSIPDRYGTFTPSGRGRIHAAGRLALGVDRLPSDPVGTFTLTLTNVAVGSRYRVERVADGSVATPVGQAEGVAASSSVPMSLDYFTDGNPNNNLRIKVRKGTSATRYKPLETQAVAGRGSQSVYIAQVSDE